MGMTIRVDQSLETTMKLREELAEKIGLSRGLVAAEADRYTVRAILKDIKHKLEVE